MSKTLNVLVARYLNENGIKRIFFADYIDENRDAINKWLNGKGNITPAAIKKVHVFLKESYKSPEEILKEE